MYTNDFWILFSLYFHKSSKAFKSVSVITELKRLNKSLNTFEKYKMLKGIQILRLCFQAVFL